MYNGGKIITGLILFLALITLPFWYNTVSAGYTPPDLEYPDKSVATECVEDKDWMRAEHMQLLNDWRDWVVRGGNRLYTSKKSGVSFEMSLQESCMQCHTSKEKFCDRCHDSASVNTYCWDCHIAPKEGK